MSKKLLLADDSVTIQKVVNLTFADEGIEVITAGDGETAMRMLAETAPDLVMADVNMPGMSGYQLCEQIRQNDSLKNTPVILLVGSFEPFDEEEARRVGADDFLTKPFQSIRQLVNKVTTLLDSAANGQSAVSGLADTRELNKTETETAAEYGDAGLDDEMISSSTSSGFAYEEAQKSAGRDYEERNEEDLARTQPLSREDLAEISASQGETYSPYGTATVQAYEQREEALPERAEERREETQKNVSSALLEEDDDLLELPPLFDEEEEAPEPAQEVQTRTPAAEPVAETPAVAAENQTAQEANEAPSSAPAFPPELIDAIARRVVEKLSENAVKEIAWEVVPQQADLIIRKMVEEKLKE